MTLVTFLVVLCFRAIPALLVMEFFGWMFSVKNIMIFKMDALVLLDMAKLYLCFEDNDRKFYKFVSKYEFNLFL